MSLTLHLKLYWVLAELGHPCSEHVALGQAHVVPAPSSLAEQGLTGGDVLHRAACARAWHMGTGSGNRHGSHCAASLQSLHWAPSRPCLEAGVMQMPCMCLALRGHPCHLPLDLPCQLPQGAVSRRVYLVTKRAVCAGSVLVCCSCHRAGRSLREA